MSLSFANILSVLLPVLMILSTATNVLFSEEGLFENIAVYEKIVRFEEKTGLLQEKNESLKQKILVLKSRREKVVFQMSIEHLAAPKGASIYRFEE